MSNTTELFFEFKTISEVRLGSVRLIEFKHSHDSGWFEDNELVVRLSLLDLPVKVVVIDSMSSLIAFNAGINATSMAK